MITLLALGDIPSTVLVTVFVVGLAFLGIPLYGLRLSPEDRLLLACIASLGEAPAFAICTIFFARRNAAGSAHVRVYFALARLQRHGLVALRRANGHPEVLYRLTPHGITVQRRFTARSNELQGTHDERTPAA